MTIRKITIIAAIALAAGSGLLVLFFLTSVQQSNSRATATTRVFVADRTIGARTPLAAEMFRPDVRAKSKVDPDVVTDLNAISGQIALIDIPAGAILTSSKMGAALTNLGMAFRLRPGQRAMSISVDPVKDVSGFIQPGDRVDVLAQGPAVGNVVQPSVTILRGILVLGTGVAVKSNNTPEGPSPETVGTVTLALTPTQASTLMTADLNAVVRLALRSPTEPLRSGPIGRIVYTNPAIGTAAQPAQASAPLPMYAPPIAQPAPVARRSTTATVNGVTVIEGSDVTGSSH
ncbi:MAG TPA: Flp pilus assembly protein CpaB [Candidatus Baltobacteraceae bacterium]